MGAMPEHHGSHGLYEVFLSVAEAGSFTAAADALGYTQSAVSRRVQVLEGELGSALFDRLPRGVALSPAGRALLPHARAIAERDAAARAELDALRRMDGGRLRTGSFATADAALVPGALAVFRERHPRVHVARCEGFTPDLLAQAAAGEIDIAVVSSPPEGAAERCELHPLLEEPVHVALPRGHRLAGRGSVRLAELAGEDWIAGAERPEATLLAPAVREGFRPRVAHVVREWIGKQGFVAAGLGVTLLPALAAASVRPDIAVVRVDGADLPPRPVFAAVPAGRSGPPAAAAFLEALRGTAARIVRPAPPR